MTDYTLNIEQKKCVVCKKIFLIPTKNKKRYTRSDLRPRNSITCSKRCSHNYTNYLRHGLNIPIKMEGVN